MTDIFCNSARQKAKNVLVAPQTGSGSPYSFTMFPRTFTETVARDNAQLVFQGDEDVIDPITLVADAGHTILHPFNFTPVSSIQISLQGRSVQLSFFAALNQWVVLREPTITYLEAWQATPIVDLPVAPGATIQWTQIPLFLGQTSNIFVEAAGIFTYNLPANFNVQVKMRTETQANMINNTDVSWIYAPVFSGAGVNLMGRIIQTQQSSRSATFFWSAENSGVIAFANADTFLYNASSVKTGATADLGGAVLTFAIDL